MKKTSPFFTPTMQEALEKELGVTLADGHEHSKDELEALFQRIVEEFSFFYDGGSGRPIGLTATVEHMIDAFVKNKLIAFH